MVSKTNEMSSSLIAPAKKGLRIGYNLESFLIESAYLINTARLLGLHFIFQKFTKFTTKKALRLVDTKIFSDIIV